MIEASTLADHINASMPSLKSGTVRIYGDWLGRPYDNVCIITEASAQGNCLVVRFIEGEQLEIWDPRWFTVDAATFRIRQASRVVWEAYAYGAAHTPGNLRRNEYIPSTGGVEVRRSGQQLERTEMDRYPAVEIL